MKILQFAEYATEVLNKTPSKKWGATFVNLRSEFNYRFPHKTFSTSHGVDFFNNIIECCAGKEWNDKFTYTDDKGKTHTVISEYEKNFKELIKFAISEYELPIL